MVLFWAGGCVCQFGSILGFILVDNFCWLTKLRWISPDWFCPVGSWHEMLTFCSWIPFKFRFDVNEAGASVYFTKTQPMTPNLGAMQRTVICIPMFWNFYNQKKIHECIKQTNNRNQQAVPYLSSYLAILAHRNKTSRVKAPLGLLTPSFMPFHLISKFTFDGCECALDE